MRLLFYKRKSSPFFLGISIPSPRELSKLRESSPDLYAALFDSDDGSGSGLPFRVPVSLLAELCISYLAENKEDSKGRNAKFVEWYCNDRERSFGRCKSCAGFTVKGVGGIARIRDGVALVVLGKSTQTVCGDIFAIDNGQIHVHYSKGTGAYEFVSLIDDSLSGLRNKTILIEVEY